MSQTPHGAGDVYKRQIPMLIQMPILIAMFRFFPASIELREQPFLWADDLSSYDSIVNLPFSIPFYGDHVSLFALLMAVSLFGYSWFNYCLLYTSRKAAAQGNRGNGGRRRGAASRDAEPEKGRERLERVSGRRQRRVRLGGFPALRRCRGMGEDVYKRQGLWVRSPSGRPIRSTMPFASSLLDASSMSIT